MKEQLIEKILEKSLLGDTDKASASVSEKINNMFEGEYVLVRGYDAGVWAGKLIDGTKGNIILQDARMLWRWWCKEGIGLSGIATHGLAIREEVRILEKQDKILINDYRVSTFFQCNKDVEKQIREYPVAVQS